MVGDKIKISSNVFYKLDIKSKSIKPLIGIQLSLSIQIISPIHTVSMKRILISKQNNHSLYLATLLLANGAKKDYYTSIENN